MTNSSVPVAFPVPFAGAERQSWRAIARGLGRNALAGFPPRAFEEMAPVPRSWARWRFRRRWTITLQPDRSPPFRLYAR